MTKITLINDDISKLKVDCIVNAANNELIRGGGVDGCIRMNAGLDIEKEISDYRNKNDNLKTGECFITNGYELLCKYVIHTVGPYYGAENGREKELLINCYLNSLKLAKEYNIKTIAFPNISTGVFRYPKEDACKIAIETVRNFIKNDNCFDEIIFVSFWSRDFEMYKQELEK